jgi:signal transduction histidine kinase
LARSMLLAVLAEERRQARLVQRELGGRLISAQDEERKRIARELHDDFSQRLALQCIELTQLENNLPKSEFEERSRVLKILTETKEMSKDMRSLSHQLHSSSLELVGLTPALRGLCAEITKNYKITIDFTGPEIPPSLTKDMELCLFRVAQEALANVIKHSQASGAHVELGSNANVVGLRISDKGNGFDPDQTIVGTGIGLVSMRERLRVLDGRLLVRSEITRGTEVLAEIPLSALENKNGHDARGVKMKS